MYFSADERDLYDLISPGDWKCFCGDDIEVHANDILDAIKER
jgi:hypothetical protein